MSDDRKRIIGDLNTMLHPAGRKHRNYAAALTLIRRLEEMPQSDPQRTALAGLRATVEPHVNEFGTRHPIDWPAFEGAWLTETGEAILP